MEPKGKKVSVKSLEVIKIKSIIQVTRTGKQNIAGWNLKMYTSSHNHGFVENGVLEDVFSLVSKWAIFHFHDYGRKGISY